MAAFSPDLPFAVAFSGGVDSTALLRACVERWPRQVYAIHVNHGLQAAASGFESHCRDLCALWQVPLHTVSVDARAGAGFSPEAVARDVRYAALKDGAHRAWPGKPPRLVALAQHADDQAETVLLALSRGAGLRGLSGMPASWVDEGVRFARPLLGVSRPAIEAWLAQLGVEAVQDPTNIDMRFTRNRIRHRVLPALESVTPAWRDVLARTAGHAAQAQALLDEIGAEDLTLIGVPPVLKRLQDLSEPRLANVLRLWLHAHCAGAASAAQLAELMHQVQACRTQGHAIELKVGAGQVRREGGLLTWQPIKA